jgi:signal transduction histidine kinase
MNSSSNQPVAKLLIVDDEAAQMTALCRTLEDEGYATTGFTSPKKALAALNEQEFDLILTDLMMPEMDGIALLTTAQAIDRNLVAIVMTGHSAVETAVQAMKAGALDYIQKPFKLRNVLPVLTRALTVRRLRMENIQLRQAIAIHELCTAFIQGLNRRSVADRVADVAFQQSTNGRVAVLILSEDRRFLNVIAVRGSNAHQLEGKGIPYNTAIKEWGQHMCERFADIGTWTQMDFSFDYADKDFSAAISMPMLAGGELVGILNFSAGTPTSTITLGQLKTLSILAGTAASAIEVATLLEQLREANENLEKRVAQRTAQLELANNELEAFSYSVSHDLRAPLRAMLGYSDLLLQDVGNQLPLESRRTLEGIGTAGHRMSELISDLLKLSQLSREPVVLKSVSIEILVKDVLKELQRDHPNRSIDIQVDSLPGCMGDESLLRQVFVNLLTNAYKFTKHTPVARIDIGAHEEGSETVYFVRDNGAGFDMAHAKRLFGVFQRLHSSSDFEGTGIGLSIVQRIVQRHEGHIWAAGEVGKGATFYLRLTKSNPSSGVLHNTQQDTGVDSKKNVS